MPSSPWKTLAHAEFCQRIVSRPETRFQTAAWTALVERCRVDLVACRQCTWEDPGEHSWPAEARARRDELVALFRNRCANLPSARKPTSRHVVAWSQSLDGLEDEIRALERRHDPPEPEDRRGRRRSSVPWRPLR